MRATDIVLYGAAGRMGAAIGDMIDDRDDLHIVARIDPRWESGVISGLDRGAVIDFSTPEGAVGALEFARAHGLALVSGTTGLDESYFEALNEASDVISVLHAANMSLGVTVVRDLVRRAAAALPPSFHAEIVELHHKHKVDAPSGTALVLADELTVGRGRAGRGDLVTARSGAVGERSDAEIGVFAIRGGDVAGEHTVYFLGEGERVEITHRATDRHIFASGAVAAAAWIVDKAPGRYTIADVLGLR